METVVVADSDLMPVFICLFSVSSVSESQIATSALHPPTFHPPPPLPPPPKFFQDITDFEPVFSFGNVKLVIS